MYVIATDTTGWFLLVTIYAVSNSIVYNYVYIEVFKH